LLRAPGFTLTTILTLALALALALGIEAAIAIFTVVNVIRVRDWSSSFRLSSVIKFREIWQLKTSLLVDMHPELITLIRLQTRFNSQAG
jgi:hypothetical protein